MRRANRFFEGRNGTDVLSCALCILACVLLIISRIFGGIIGTVLWALAFASLGWGYFRILSRNIPKRRLEDARFRQLFSPATRFIARQKTKHRQKNLFCFFKCPNCGTVLRVPKGKGRIRITCKSCQYVFERET